MALTSNFLKTQVDLPVFEMLRPAPAVSSAVSSTCTTDNGIFHVQHGRYIYYLIAAASFYRYDTWTDTYIQLSSPPITPLTWSSMSFAGAKGYEGKIIASPSSTTLQMAMPFANVGKTFDIRITDGTGKGQRRIITDVSTPVIHEWGAATAGSNLLLTDTNKTWQVNQWVGYQVRIISGAGTGQVRKILFNSATTLTFADVTKYLEDTNCNAPLITPAGSGSIYQIESSIVTVNVAFSPQPDATSRFLVESGGVYLATSLATAFYALAYYDILSDVWYIKTASSTIISATGTDGTLERCTENASIWDRGIATATGSDTTHLADATKYWRQDQWVGYYVRIFSGTGEGQLKKITGNTNTILAWAGAATTPDATSSYLIVGFDAGTCSGNSIADSAASASVTASAYGNVLTVSAVGSGALMQGAILKGTGLGAVLAFNNATSSGAVVTVGSTAGIQVGMVMVMISGTGTLVAGTVATVINVLNATTFTISQTPTLALSGTNVFMLGGGLGGQTAFTSGGGSGSGTTITVTSTTNLQVGMAPFVSGGTGSFAGGTIVTSIVSATQFTVDTAPAVGLSGATVVACFPQPVILGEQITGTSGSTGTYKIYPLQPVVASTTVTATGLAVLVDSTKSTWAVNRWNNLAVRITGGTGKGQVRSIQATIPGYLSVSPDWTTALDNTSTYEIQGDPDKLYLMLGGNASVYVQNLNADLLTTGRAETNGIAVGLVAQYADYSPIAISTGVYSNPTMTITTVNVHPLKTGMSVTISGDNGAGKALNNITATITVTSTTTFTYSVGAGSANMAAVAGQTTSSLIDASKNWTINQWAGCIVTYNTAAPTQTTGLATVFSELIIANNTNTLFFARVGTAPILGATRYVITQNHMSASKSAIGALDAGISVGNSNSTSVLGDFTKGFTSVATSCSSSGTTVTTTGNLKGLSVGMNVRVSGGTGAFISTTKVATLISDTQFTVDTLPTTTLSGATVEATFWMAGSLVGRRARIIAGPGQFQEWPLTGNTFQTLTMTAITTAPATGTSVYEIIPIPTRALGLKLHWIFGQTDSSEKGSFIYIPRGTSPQIDRLNLQTDTWEVVHMVPQVESLTTGTQWAYDGMDKIYIIVNGSLRMLYLDVNTHVIHGGMMLPYLIGTPIIGNRTEIFETQDGLRYLWTNRQSNVEAFRALLYW